MKTLRPIAALALAALASAQTAAQTGAQESEWKRYTNRYFALDVPASWRELTPDDARTLGDRLPYMMQAVLPGQTWSLGDVDRWLSTGFDGQALLVLVGGSEWPADEEGIALIRSHWAAHPLPSGPRAIESAHVVPLGPAAHPAIECRIVSPDPTGPYHTLEYYASTAGHLLILGFRSWQDDAAEAVPRFERMAGSLTFPMPPRTPGELGDRLLQAAFVGALVGLALLALRKMRRR